MIISFRERLLIKSAENPNKYPWNVSDRSKVDPKTGERESGNETDTLKQIIFDIPIDEEREISDEESPFISWEARVPIADRFKKTQKD